MSSIPSGRLALSGSDDKTVKLWDVASGKMSTFSGHPDEVHSIDLSPDGKLALSGNEDKTLDFGTSEVVVSSRT